MEEMNYAPETLRCLSGFEQVWARVTGGIPQQHSSSVGLEALIWKLYCLRRLYAALAGHEESVMRRLYQQTDRHMRRLQAEYFICSGMHWHTGERFALPKGKTAMLRRVLILEDELTAEFANAAADCSEPALQPLWEHLSAEAEARRKTVRKALVSCF